MGVRRRRGGREGGEGGGKEERGEGRRRGGREGGEGGGKEEMGEGRRRGGREGKEVATLYRVVRLWSMGTCVGYTEQHLALKLHPSLAKREAQVKGSSSALL